MRLRSLIALLPAGTPLRLAERPIENGRPFPTPRDPDRIHSIAGGKAEAYLSDQVTRFVLATP